MLGLSLSLKMQKGSCFIKYPHHSQWHTHRNHYISLKSLGNTPHQVTSSITVALINLLTWQREPTVLLEAQTLHTWLYQGMRSIPWSTSTNSLIQVLMHPSVNPMLCRFVMTLWQHPGQMMSQEVLMGWMETMTGRIIQWVLLTLLTLILSLVKIIQD